MLKIEAVKYAYKTGPNVLQSVSADFEKGKLYCIEGKSGSGKTTLLSLISGLDRVTDGDIKIENESLKEINLDDYRANKIGVIFQSFNLLMQLTAIENIMVSIKNSKYKVDDINKYILNLLELVGINEEKANRKVVELSGGEQQRIAIARSISHSPDYIIADEPTGNLDFETEKVIMELFKKFVEDGKCVIVVTHSNRVVKYADQVYHMKKGILSKSADKVSMNQQRPPQKH